MSIESDFRKRAKDVRAYLKSLQDIQNKVNIPGRRFYRSTATVAASKAAVYIMIYNFLESSISGSLISVRNDIHVGRHNFADLTDFWQQDFTKAKYLEKASQGTNHSNLLKDIVITSGSVIEWHETEKRLPFSGNLDHKIIINLAKQMGLTWKAPKGTRGGEYLSIVKSNRNELAHGSETFEDVGQSVDIDALILELDSIRSFILSFIRAVENYRVRKKYLRH